MGDKRSFQASRASASIDDFFLRAGLRPQDRLDCYAFVEQLCPGRAISLASDQGYCSMTIFAGDDLVVQFRPNTYRLDLRVAEAAREVYGAFAPDTKYVTTLPSGLLVYTMNRVKGISFQGFRAGNTVAKHIEPRARLCGDFAAFLATGWQKHKTASIPLGLVGRSIQPRLESLSIELPIRFQGIAKNLLRELYRVEALPWVLTHGDIVAGNIMVESPSCHLSGFVDWAEAECLPFGVCLYGLEEILGEITPAGFHYHEGAEELRQRFWRELAGCIPELQQRSVLEAVHLARDLGVLLWHGIAFDDGAINRVVQEGKDINEIYRLDAIFDTRKEECTARVSKI
jgi:hypothetical protein